ncbi:AtuA-related protein [Cytobacillus oceanisediminis]|uniref:AtuA-related protein n=1 Tax=Cytobacillus oceanisediminis TaxID=665099 RepID=UPI003735C410
MKKVKLFEIAHSRTGDKGNTLNFSLIPYNDDHYQVLAEQVTAEKVKDHLNQIIKGKVTRYDLPKIKAFNFVCEEALLGGVTTSLAIDTHGKTISSAVLEMEIKLTN